MAASLTELLASLQNGVTAINNLTSQIATTFPQASALSTTAPSTGSIVFISSEAKSFLTVTTSSGATYYVALY